MNIETMQSATPRRDYVRALRYVAAEIVAEMDRSRLSHHDSPHLTGWEKTLVDAANWVAHQRHISGDPDYDNKTLYRVRGGRIEIANYPPTIPGEPAEYVFVAEPTPRGERGERRETMTSDNITLLGTYEFGTASEWITDRLGDQWCPLNVEWADVFRACGLPDDDEDDTICPIETPLEIGETTYPADGSHFVVLGCTCTGHTFHVVRITPEYVTTVKVDLDDVPEISYDTELRCGRRETYVGWYASAEHDLVSGSPFLPRWSLDHGPIRDGVVGPFATREEAIADLVL